MMKNKIIPQIKIKVDKKKKKPQNERNETKQTIHNNSVAKRGLTRCPDILVSLHRVVYTTRLIIRLIF